ncbi:M15 family metallopeptidase [Zhouia spongiae]|uniref:M15 family metallopeptidase n=1 Tax=Zhouia spongiae TaxID=2202721 RepID=A0ABY3YI93_9FLAO|nr:M15 family metallopeptidase [Zhouia spongiae]UNY97352.1 M15 family metallopeptidase [Zhouia spongiae]
MKKLLILFIIGGITGMQGQTHDISVDELLGKGSPELFGDGIHLRKEAYECFLQMQEAAAKEGIIIANASSYRGYSRQKQIWERKFRKYTAQGMPPRQAIARIIEYSTIPGTSRHHWGTDIDIVDGSKKVSGDLLDPEKFAHGGPYEPLKKWMDKNAHKYGFYLVYTDNPDRKGFKYEPWHFSYAPLSIGYLQQFRKIDIKEKLMADRLMGVEAFSESFIEQYIKNNILDINPELL